MGNARSESLVVGLFTCTQYPIKRHRLECTYSTTPTWSQNGECKTIHRFCCCQWFERCFGRRLECWLGRLGRKLERRSIRFCNPISCFWCESHSWLCCFQRCENYHASRNICFGNQLRTPYWQSHWIYEKQRIWCCENRLCGLDYSAWWKTRRAMDGESLHPCGWKNGWKPNHVGCTRTGSPDRTFAYLSELAGLRSCTWEWIQCLECRKPTGTRNHFALYTLDGWPNGLYSGNFWDKNELL